MNEKQKAEAYVRSQIKELMEPKAGCRLICKGDAWHEHGIMIRGDKLSNLTTGKIEQRDDTWEIIGHPIQLQHYLQILDKIADKQKVIYRLINCRVLYFGKVIVKFHQKTGQPEDEEDWKAFNQIVGK